MTGPSVEEAVDLALDVYIDTITDGADLHVAFNAVAVNVLDFAADQPIDRLDADSAVLDDGTRITLRPDWAPVTSRARLAHMLGYKARLRHLPVAISRIETLDGTVLHTWPMLDVNVLRGFNSYEPVLVRANGSRLYAPHDATNTDGLLLITPSISLEFNTGDVTFSDLDLA